jgi:hypothetical protein
VRLRRSLRVSVGGVICTVSVVVMADTMADGRVPAHPALP